MDLTKDQNSTIRIDKVRRRVDGFMKVGLTKEASAGIVGEPVTNLCHWKADPEIHSSHFKTVRLNK